MTQLSAAPKQPGQGVRATTDSSKALYGGKSTRRITVRDITAAKERGEKWPMLTAYDAMTASVFDEAGIPVMLVGDSAGNCHLRYESTVPVTLDEMAMLSAAVVRGTSRALIVGDLPFGSYQEGPVQALRSATRLVKEAGVGAVKLEGGERSHRQIELLVESGIPVMAHIGLTPQSVNAMGYRVQGRGEEAAQQLLRDAKAVQDAGAFAVVLELVPAELAAEVTRTLHIPTVGIGAARRPTRRSWCGPTCSASPAARCRSSSRSTPICARSWATRRGRSRTTSSAERSLLRNTPSTEPNRPGA